MTTLTWLTQGSGVVAKNEMHRFIRDCFLKVGVPEENADLVADSMVTSDYRGQYSHGINRLELYLKHIKLKRSDPTATPIVLKETPATAWVDGCNALGPVVGNFCMEIAISKAAEVGVSWVAAKGSSNYGMCAYYSMKALEHGMIGFTCCNTLPLLVPTRAKKAFLGTNPLSCAAPARYGDSFVLDMSSTTTAMGKVEMKRREQKRVPEGWALNEFGQTVTDPVEVLQTPLLSPLGFSEEQSSYKGTGLAIMVEVLSALLADAASGPDVPDWLADTSQPLNIGQCFAAIDPSCFAPNYEQRLYDLLYRMRGMDPVDRDKKVLAAGDPERAHMKLVDLAGGISYHSNTLKMAAALAESLGVQPPTIK